MIRFVFILLMMLMAIPGTAGAAKLYLKDGGIIECFLAKQQGALVYVLVNRDTEIELDRSEVAIKKTFKGKKSIGSYHPKRHSCSNRR